MAGVNHHAWHHDLDVIDNFILPHLNWFGGFTNKQSINHIFQNFSDYFKFSEPLYNIDKDQMVSITFYETEQMPKDSLRFFHF